jgi:hypothetical protein
MARRTAEHVLRLDPDRLEITPAEVPDVSAKLSSIVAMV